MEIFNSVFFSKPTVKILENDMKSNYDLKDLSWKATFPKRRKLGKTYLHGGSWDYTCEQLF